MSDGPVITGLGLVTPLGTGVDENWSALLAGRSIGTHARCPLDDSSPDRVHRLAIEAAREAMLEARWESRPVPGPGERSTEGPARGRTGSPEDSRGCRTGLVVGTSKGAVETWMTAPPVELNFGLSSIGVALRETFPLLDGPGVTVSAACASGIHALARAAMMIQSGEADRVLVVAAEASVHPLFLGSFQRLGVLPREGVGCLPFDVERDGFLMSEAAAVVCLESAPQAGNVGVRIDRFALGGDATHLTAGDPKGETMRRLLRDALCGRSVDLVHAHGTGTTLNDPVELAAIDDECQRVHSPAIVYSHKGALGHSLGAAGLVSAVLSCRMHRDQLVPGLAPPTSYKAGYVKKCLPTQFVRICTENTRIAIKRSLIVAAGFGGPVALTSLESL